MTAFRPCIDLHQGRVKQIVGGTLSESGQGLRTNFVSEHGAAWFADRYKRDGLSGGHIIMLGSGNEQEALAALRAFPGGMQIGGGLDDTNILPYLDAGASHVILTSWLFPKGIFSLERLQRISKLAGKERLVVDLSCRRRGPDWFVAMNRWQTVTEVRIEAALLETLSAHCQEFLIHAADVEGRCEGMDWELVDLLTAISPIPTTYAGGSRDVSDLELLQERSRGRLDLSIGSALDLFGGNLVRYADCVAFNGKEGSTGEADGEHG
jgi:phosphoribosylformimino-5-aminoimidazole carboxamide ribotide isomerase